MSLANVYKNFLYRIASITPTNKTVGKGYRFVSPRDFDPDEAQGVARTFTVYWDGSDEDVEPTDITERIAPHSFTLEVAYSTSFPVDTLHQIILDDRDDLITKLRDTDSYTGISVSNPATDVGLWARVRARDDIDRGGTHTWYLRQTWTCTVREAE